MAWVGAKSLAPRRFNGRAGGAHASRPGQEVPVGKTKFCDDYGKYAASRALTNHRHVQQGDSALQDHNCAAERLAIAAGYNG